MTLFGAFLFVLAGLAMLVAGGEVLLRGAVGLATLSRLTPSVIGLTVVAAGTSVPELAVSGIAAFQGKNDIAVGNVVGSNIFNIAFILGLTAVYRRITIAGRAVRLEYPAMFFATAAFVLLARDGVIGRAEALFFITAYICFTGYLVKLVRGELAPQVVTELANEVTELEPAQSGVEPKLGVCLGLLAAGIGLLGWGADLAVEGASTIGKIAGLSDAVIGLTIVAGGTGLPELVTSLVSSYRGRNDVAVANVIGSNIFNLLMILGITGVISPITVSTQIINSDSLWLIAVTALMFPIMKSNLDISRREGGILLAVYGVYLLQLIVRS